MAGATDCGSGECPVYERAKDVGDAAIKDLAPYIGVAGACIRYGDKWRS